MHEQCPHYDAATWSAAEAASFALASDCYPMQIAMMQQDVRTRTMQQCVQYFYAEQK
jgi:hypothetical protein